MMSCILGFSSILLSFLFVLVGFEYLVPSTMLVLALFTFVAAGASFVSKEKKKFLSLIGPAFVLAIPLLILIESYLPGTASFTYTDPKTGEMICIVQKGKNQTYFIKRRTEANEWTELTKAEFDNRKVETGKVVNASQPAGLSENHLHD